MNSQDCDQCGSLCTWSLHHTMGSTDGLTYSAQPTSVTTNCKNYSRNVWRFWLEELAEKWPIILKNCSMLGATYNAQKNASIIYLSLTTAGIFTQQEVAPTCPTAYDVSVSYVLWEHCMWQVWITVVASFDLHRTHAPRSPFPTQSFPSWMGYLVVVWGTIPEFMDWSRYYT